MSPPDDDNQKARAMMKPITIKTQTVYEAEDGAQFDTISEATLYQIKFDIEDWLEAVQPSGSFEDYGKLARYIWQNRIQFINALQDASNAYEQALRDDSLRKDGEEEGE